MKLKLLLCYILVACSLCFIRIVALDGGYNDDDETPEIVSDSVEAMGSMPRKIAKKVSNGGRNFEVSSSADPYAKVLLPAKIDVQTGDPYAKSTARVEAVQGDPYASIGGASVVVKAMPTAPSVAIKKEVVLAPKKIVQVKSSANITKIAPKAVKKPFVPREQLSLTSALFKSVGNSDDPLSSEAQAAVQEIDNEIKNRENQLKKVAEEHLVSVTREISEQAAQLREEADAAARKLKANTEGSVQALLKTAEDRITKLNTEVAQESFRLKQDAAMKALTVIDAMEQRAAAQRVQERKRALAATFGLPELDFDNEAPVAKKPQKASPKKAISQEVEVATITSASNAVPVSPLKDPSKANVVSAGAVTENFAPASGSGQIALRVSAEWKNDLSRRFYQDMTMMKDIILDAESALEVQDFLKKFEEQNKWFDLTLRSTRLVTDDQYAQLVAKQSQMDRLMQSQRSADDYLQKFTKNMVLDQAQFKKMRLGVLYELNARVQQRASHLDRAIRESSLPDEEVKLLVKQTLSDFSQQFREIAAQFPDVEMGGALNKPQLSIAAVPLMTQQLEQELNDVKTAMEEGKKEVVSMQQKLTSVQEDLLGVQDAAKKTQEALDLERAEKEALLLKNNGIKTAALGFIDKQARENTETDLVLTGVRQDNAELRSEIANVVAKNDVLSNQKKSLIGAVEAARKDSINSDLQRNEDVSRAQQKVIIVQRQARDQIRSIQESGAKIELSLTADLRSAHEKIAHLSTKQAQLVQELGLQRQVAAKLRSSLKVAQEDAGKAETEADLVKQVLSENGTAIKKQVVLRQQAESRAKITEELAQKTIDSINGFLVSERKTLAKREAKLDSQEDFLDAYRAQLSRDRDMLENLKLETRKVVQHSADLSEALSDDFVQMQEQIESELRQAHLETKRELTLAKNRLDNAQTSNNGGDLDGVLQTLATTASQQDNEDDEQPQQVARPPVKAVMPGAKQLANKQPVARMPGLV